MLKGLSRLILSLIQRPEKDMFISTGSAAENAAGNPGEQADREITNPVLSKSINSLAALNTICDLYLQGPGQATKRALRIA